MMHGFQQIIAQAERCYNFVVHGLPPLGDEMRVSPLIWRKKLMDSISGNLGYYHSRVRHGQPRKCSAPPEQPGTSTSPAERCSMRVSRYCYTCSKPRFTEAELRGPGTCDCPPPDPRNTLERVVEVQRARLTGEPIRKVMPKRVWIASPHVTTYAGRE